MRTIGVVAIAIGCGRPDAQLAGAPLDPEAGLFGGGPLDPFPSFLHVGPDGHLALDADH